MSHLTDFYSLKAPDTQGRMLGDILKWSDDAWECHHDYIQWLFPLDQPSGFNPNAPLLTEADRAAFRASAKLQLVLRRGSLARFLAFLGLFSEDDVVIRPGDNFNNRRALWAYPNHNWLRITRVLKSLRLLGLEADARAFWRCLQKLHEERGFKFEGSFSYWQAAAGE